MTIPVVIEMTYHIFHGEPLSISTFYTNLLNDLNGHEVFVLVQILVVLAGIWIIGGWTGRLVIDKNYSNKVVGFITFFILWVLLFISCALTEGLISSLNWGIDGIESAIIRWLVYGLFPFIIAGILNGLTIGLLFGNELGNKKQRHLHNST